MKISVLALVILILDLAFFSASAQCDAALTPSSNQQIAYKSRGSRCEGFYAAKVAANRLKVISFTIGDLRFLPEENEIIEIQSTEPKLNIRAEGIPNDLYYRMDASTNNGSFSWPVKEVLIQDARTKIARNIGILAYLPKTTTKAIYIPVKACGQKSSADPNELPLLKMVCTTKLTHVQWRLQGESEYRKLEGSVFRAFAPILIRIPADVKGEKTIQIRAKEENSLEWLPTSIHVKI